MSYITMQHIMNSLKKRESLNILTFYHNGLFEKELVKLGHSVFYVKANNHPVVETPGIYPVNLNNFNMIYDVILCTECLINYENAMSLSHQLHIPVVFYEHFQAPPHLTPDKLLLNKKKYRGATLVFPNLKTANSWKYTERDCIIADYNLEINLNRNNIKEKTKAKIWGSYSNPNDVNIFNHFMENIAGLEVVDVNSEIHTVFDDCDVYISLCASVETPLDILSAMNAGAIVLTNQNGATDDLIKDKENGFIIEKLEDFRSKIEILRRNPDEAKRIRNNAIETIKSRRNTFHNLNKTLLNVAHQRYAK